MSSELEWVLPLGAEDADVLCCVWFWLDVAIASQVLMLVSPSSQPLTDS